MPSSPAVSAPATAAKTMRHAERHRALETQVLHLDRAGVLHDEDQQQDKHQGGDDQRDPGGPGAGVPASRRSGRNRTRQRRLDGLAGRLERAGEVARLLLAQDWLADRRVLRETSMGPAVAGSARIRNRADRSRAAARSVRRESGRREVVRTRGKVSGDVRRVAVALRWAGHQGRASGVLPGPTGRSRRAFSIRARLRIGRHPQFTTPSGPAVSRRAGSSIRHFGITVCARPVADQTQQGPVAGVPPRHRKLIRRSAGAGLVSVLHALRRKERWPGIGGCRPMC